MIMDLLVEKLLGFALVLTRLSAFFLILPVFGWKAIPVRVRVSLTVLLAVFFAAVRPFSAGTEQITSLQAGLMIMAESVYGLALGLSAALLFAVVQFAGRIIERQMGMAMAEVLDPMTGDRSQPLGSLLEMIFILLFLAANGHHLFLMIISRSYEIFPVGTIPSLQILTEGVIEAGSTMFTAALRLAAPILAAFLVLLVVLAVLARVVPEMNILFISFPLRIGLGLMMTAMFIPFVNSYITELAQWMGRILPV